MDEVEQLIAQINDADMDVRWKAIGATDRMYDARLIGPLVERLTDREPEVRARAARALHGKYDDRIVPSLLPLLHDRDPEVRAGACHGLGGRYWRAALDELLDRLHDHETEVRAAAAESLHSYPSRRAVDALLLTCHDPAESVRAAVAESLGSFDDPAVVLPLLRLAQSDSDRHVRRKAIEALQYVVHPHTITFMEIIYPERDAIKQLLALLDDEDDLIAAEAIQTLGAIGDERAINALVATLFNWSTYPGLRMWAASALGNFDDPRLTPVLIATLQDPDAYIRVVAARSLGRRCDPQALPALDALIGENDELGKAAAQAAEHIRYELSWEEFDQVVEYLEHGKDDERLRAVKCLEKIAEPRAQELIIRALDQAIELNDIFVFVAAGKICVNRGEAAALPLLAKGAEFWGEKKARGMVQEAEQAANYLRRKLNGEELEPYRSIFDDDDEEYGLDDEDEDEAAM